MSAASDWELVGRLVLVAALGFFIGLEREFRGQAAGERTPSSASGRRPLP